MCRLSAVTCVTQPISLMPKRSSKLFSYASRFPLPTSRFTLLYVPLTLVTVIMLITDTAIRDPAPLNISLIIYIHPSFSVHVSAKSEQTHFSNSRLFTSEAGSVRWEVVWDIFEQSTSNHFSVHVGSGKCESVWNFSLK